LDVVHASRTPWPGAHSEQHRSKLLTACCPEGHVRLEACVNERERTSGECKVCGMQAPRIHCLKAWAYQVQIKVASMALAQGRQALVAITQLDAWEPGAHLHQTALPRLLQPPCLPTP
jgi:hypothetical protein